MSYSKRIVVAKKDNSNVKDRIQDLVREIVILRDDTCVLYGVADVPSCNGHAKDGHLILQADHLITRSNSATYSDTRLIVCICKGHHGWKKWNEERYNEVMRSVLPTARVSLWLQCQDARYRSVRMRASDWLNEEAALKQELRQLQLSTGNPHL